VQRKGSAYESRIFSERGPSKTGGRKNAAFGEGFAGKFTKKKRTRASETNGGREKVMSYTQNLQGSLLQEQEKKAIEEKLHSGVIKEFQLKAQEGGFPQLSCVSSQDDLPLYEDAARRLAQFEEILIFGTGGSSLGGKTLCTLGRQEKPRLTFMDNIDPHTFETLFRTLNPEKTGIITISKSGSTVETLMQILTFIETYGDLPSAHFLLITEPTDNPLRRLATQKGWPCLDHPQNIGGRFSCFSLVGLIPAILAGLDPREIRKGGKDVLDLHLSTPKAPAFEGAALNVYLAEEHQKTLSVMMPYSDQLNSFSLWYRQLWAESLGKKGKGPTPVQALGTVDQHSQLQLYLEGPKDKFFTLLGLNWKERGTPLKTAVIPEFKGKTMGDLLIAEQKATYQTLINHNCPTRLMTLDSLDEYHLGGLMMHFMIETIVAAAFFGVDAFDQPAVEEGKRLSKRYMAEGEI